MTYLRKFTGLAMAATIAISAMGMSATQAQARDRTSQILVGAVALAIIGAAIASDNNNRRGYHRRQYVTRGYPYYRHDNRWRRHEVRRHHRHERHHDRRVYRRGYGNGYGTGYADAHDNNRDRHRHHDGRW